MCLMYITVLCVFNILRNSRGPIGRIHHVRFRACDNRATKEWLAFLLQAVRLNYVSCHVMTVFASVKLQVL